MVGRSAANNIDQHYLLQWQFERHAGVLQQGHNAVAIGSQAGSTRQVRYSVAIGNNAASHNQADYSIVINVIIGASFKTSDGSGLYMRRIKA